jgi:hypothetical protein
LTESGFDGLVEPEAKEPAFDVEVSIMDLRCLLREPDEAIAAEPYLHATQARTDAWRQAMDGLEGFRVGIAWQGNRQYAWDHHRSIALAEFEPLTQIEGVRLVSLQKGVGVEQLAKVPFVVEQLGNALDADAPFCDTAAVIKNLDLVITSDSAVAHLAGALGAPVWVALPFDADWRWQADKEDSQWYSTMRLFRQSARGDWPGVFARLKDAVATQANQNRR